MATEFAFEHVFRAPSIAVVFAATFSDDNVVEQDRAAGVARREWLELRNDETTFRRVSLVVPTRQLPAFVRPFIAGELRARETILWNKADDFLTIEIEPSLLDGKAHISARYRLVFDGVNAVRRNYQGVATVNLPLIGRRIERAIIDDLRASIGVTALCTQAAIDRHVGGNPH